MASWHGGYCCADYSECDGGMMAGTMETTEFRKVPARRHSRLSAETWLDLRSWAAAMFGVFGLMLTVYGAFFVTEADLAKAAGINLDLWTGIGMLVAAAGFLVWLLARPPEIEHGVHVVEGAPGAL